MKYLLPSAEQDALLVRVPGGLPPAEVELVARLAALAPGHLDGFEPLRARLADIGVKVEQHAVGAQWSAPLVC